MDHQNETLHLRKATLDDLALLRRFEQGIIAAELPMDGTLKEKDNQYYNLEAMLVDADVYLIIASLNGVAAACGYVRLEPAKLYLKYSRQGYIGFIYTEPQFRGRGLSKNILAALEAWTKEQGVDLLQLEVYAQNSSAIKAYEKFGFYTCMLQMRKTL